MNSKRPNILLITADQLRYDAFGFHGRYPVRTPTIDRLAANGTRFENAYCSNPLCVPARASIMTGLACCEHGVYYNDQGWGRELDTLPGTLSSNGYFSVVVGKTHFNPSGRYGGFDARIDIPTPEVAAMQAAASPAGPDDGGFCVSQQGRLLNYATEPSPVALEQHSTVLATERALGQLDLLASRRQIGGPAEEPFFMWLSYIRPHTPCVVPEPYFSMYAPDSLPDPVRSEAEIASFPAPLRRWYETWQSIPEETRRRVHAQYLGEVTLIDEQIGRVLQRLETLDAFENMIVIVSSDHGDYLGDHHMEQKGFFHDCSSRVPFIWSGPGIPAGRRVTENVSAIDIKHTLEAMNNLRYPECRDGRGRSIYTGVRPGESRDLNPAFAPEGSKLDSERIVVCETGIHCQGIMLKQGDRKYNYYPNAERLEHFDLSEDPGELSDRGADLAVADLPEPIRDKLEFILEQTARYRGRQYYFNGKRRQLFT